ncbi:Ammonia monooxygenase [uncultured Gammaproteobacteria bacterium]
MTLKSFIRFRDTMMLVLALSIGTVGGALFHLLRLPLAWMIGAMVATAAAAIGGATLAVPRRFRNAMVVILGVLLGGAFTPAIFTQAGTWLVSLSALVPYVALTTLIGLAYLRRIGGYDVTTAFFTATPGGLSEMTMVGGALGGDEAAISLAHSLRVIMVVMVVPVWFQLTHGETSTLAPALTNALAGARAALPGPPLSTLSLWEWALLAGCALGAPAARLVRLPASFLIGPMIVSAVVHGLGVSAVQPPGVLVAAAQVAVGAAIGCRFTGVDLHTLGRGAVIALGLTGLTLGLTMVLALTLHRTTGLGLGALILAFTPGGLTEMSLVALSLGFDVAFVSTHHIVRILLIVALAPLAYATWDRLRTVKSGAKPGAKPGALPPVSEPTSLR